ncbi:MAG: hypothetical protein WD572_06060 [Gammaproteobacteria bacterium]
MKWYGIDSLLRGLRLTGRWLVFVVLLLGLVKTPLAYSCIPLLDTNGSPISQLHNTDQPCHEPVLPALPEDPERECCLFNIDNGLRGGESGFLLTQPQTHDAPGYLAVLSSDYTDLLPGCTSTLTLVFKDRPASLTTSLLPPYLLTQRLRL